MRPAKVAPEAVGDALLATFREGGYAGASVKDLVRASGLKSASLYYRFPEGKVDMALAALARAAETFGPLVLYPLRSAGPPETRLAASAAGVRRFYDDGALACVVGVMALSDAPPPVRATVRATFEEWASALADTLADAGTAASLAEAQDRIAAVQGALVLARGADDAGPFARAVARLGSIP